tara:strand:+ start:74 stop:841 length:768 start_codon:yes stop_codon:yes gene_type:complete
MVSVDNVYQQVLAIANKEQRGYITPQEFNLFARKAQNDVFESTFQDYKDAFLHPEQVVGQHNDLNMLREKIAPFRLIDQSITMVDSVGTIDNTNGTVYWLESVYDMANNNVFEEVTKRQVNYYKDYFAAKGFPLNLEHVVFSGSGGNLEFRSKNVFYRESTNTIFFYPVPSNNFLPKCDFIKPVSAFSAPKWGYVVADHQPMYNAGASYNFVVHASEESSLVNKVLELAGVAIEKVPLSDAAMKNEQMNKADKSN